MKLSSDSKKLLTFDLFGEIHLYSGDSPDRMYLVRPDGKSASYVIFDENNKCLYINNGRNPAQRYKTESDIYKVISRARDDYYKLETDKILLGELEDDESEGCSLSSNNECL
jgi:hypothetical protein